ncbi:hypothetical protein P3S68_032880 [Capsicum galapagoense]
MGCVTTTTFSVKVNGEGCSNLEGRRWLRQGDPISPLLFFMVMEYFSRLMSSMRQIPDFRYHPLCKYLKLTHLTNFVDDLMIFCKGSEQAVTRTMEAIICFLDTTRLIANNEKSNMFIAGIKDEVKRKLLDIT